MPTWPDCAAPAGIAEFLGAATLRAVLSHMSRAELEESQQATQQASAAKGYTIQPLRQEHRQDVLR